MSAIPAIDAKQMAKVDEIMSTQFGVEPIQLMEHAGYAVATFTRMLFPEFDAAGRQVVVLAGSGGNGGDALVAARFLATWGTQVTVFLSKPAAAFSGLAAAHLHTIQRLGVPVADGATIDRLPGSAVIVDGLLGFSTNDAPRGTTAGLITMANDHDAYLLAIDVPSGMNATTGSAYEPCILASGTLTLGLPKTGLMSPDSAGITGSLVLADIGIPAAAYEAIGVDVPRDLFSSSRFLPVRDSVVPWSGEFNGP